MAGPLSPQLVDVREGTGVIASIQHRADRAAIDASRIFIRRELRQCPTEVVDNAERLAGQVVARVLGPGVSSLEITLRIGADALRVEIAGRNHRVPVQEKGAETSECGADLAFIDAISDEWGIARGNGGRTVWFVLGLSS